MDEIEWWEFDSAKELAEQAGGRHRLRRSKARSRRMATPASLCRARTALAPVFSALAKSKGIDWSKVSLLPTADRLVPLAGEQSNHRRLDGWFAAQGRRDPQPGRRSRRSADPVEAARLADARLSLLRWPLDLVCLGMDADGGTARPSLPAPISTASLNAPREPPRRRRAAAPRATSSPSPRSTLTEARTVMIVINGAGKRAVLEQAIKEGPLSSRPIGRLLATIDSPVDIFWTAEEVA